MNRKALILLAPLSLLLAFFGAWLLLRGQQNDYNASDKPSISTNQSTNSVVNKKDDGFGSGCKDIVDKSIEEAGAWNVYKGNLLGFSLKYPVTWNYQENTSKGGDEAGSVLFFKPRTVCSVEASPALCGVTVSVIPIQRGDDSPNVKYLNMLEKANVSTAEVSTKMRKICNANLDITEITDYLRHQFIFDYNGYSYSLSSENFGSDDMNKEYWDVLDAMINTIVIQ